MAKKCLTSAMGISGLHNYLLSLELNRRTCLASSRSYLPLLWYPHVETTENVQRVDKKTKNDRTMKRDAYNTESYGMVKITNSDRHNTVFLGTLGSNISETINAIDLGQ